MNTNISIEDNQMNLDEYIFNCNSADDYDNDKNDIVNFEQTADYK